MTGRRRLRWPPRYRPAPLQPVELLLAAVTVLAVVLAVAGWAWLDARWSR